MKSARCISTRRNSSPLHSLRGFTLAEVLVALAIASAVVVLGTLVFRTVVRATAAFRLGGSDIGAEQFMRTQGLFAITSETAAGFFRGTSQSLLFVTRHSLATQEDGPPVLAYYTFDEKLRSVRYAETRLPLDWRTQTSDAFSPPERWPANDALRGIDQAKFEFRGPGPRAPWQANVSEVGGLPALVRLRYSRLDGTREVVIEIGAPFSVPLAALQSRFATLPFSAWNWARASNPSRSLFRYTQYVNENWS